MIVATKFTMDAKISNSYFQDEVDIEFSNVALT